MAKYIVLLRGINVGGKNKIKMAELRSLLESNAFKNVQTYIQSGNIILESRLNEATKVEEKVKKLIKKQFGYEVPTMARTEEEWIAAYKENPFVKKNAENIKQLVVSFLSEVPLKENVKNLKEVKMGNDQFKIKGRRFYLHLGGSYLDTKFSNGTIEKKLKLQATTRNWRTVSKIMEMLASV